MAKYQRKFINKRAKLRLEAAKKELGEFDDDAVPAVVAPDGSVVEKGAVRCSSYERMLARAWTSGRFKSRAEFAVRYNLTPDKVRFWFEKPSFLLACDAMIKEESAEIASVVEDVHDLAREALEVYSEILRDPEVSAMRKRQVAKDVIDWSARISGALGAAGGAGVDSVRKVINQQFNFGDASEEDLRKIISEHTGIARVK